MSSEILSHLWKFVAAGLIGVMFVGSLWPVFSDLEGEWFPVTINTQIHEEVFSDGSVHFNVTFEKVRACEFIGLTWRDEGSRTVPVQISPTEDTARISRPEGLQVAGPWIATGVTSTDQLSAVATHRCHPLWLTYTQFLP